MPHELVRLKYSSLAADPNSAESSRRLDLKVIFTDLPKTAAALATARSMARGLGARITLMVARVVPYPLSLAEPDVPVEFTERLLESLAHEHAGTDTAVEIYLCRDRNEALRSALPSNSVVIIGARKWRDRYLTRILRRDGRQVLVVAA